MDGEGGGAATDAVPRSQASTSHAEDAIQEHAVIASQRARERAAERPGRRVARAPGRPLGRAPRRPLGRVPGRPRGRAPGRPLGRVPGRPLGRAPGRPLARAAGRPLGRAPGSPVARALRARVGRTSGGRPCRGAGRRRVACWSAMGFSRRSYVVGGYGVGHLTRLIVRTVAGGSDSAADGGMIGGRDDREVVERIEEKVEGQGASVRARIRCGGCDRRAWREEPARERFLQGGRENSRTQV